MRGDAVGIIYQCVLAVVYVQRSLHMLTLLRFGIILRSAISTHVGFACVGIASGLEKASSDWEMCECVLAFALCAHGKHFSVHIGNRIPFVVQYWTCTAARPISLLSQPLRKDAHL